MASLYVGDLHDSVTDDQLFQAFSEFKNLIDVRVCRDSSTGRSLCYGYVNFISPEDAVRAIEVKNHSALNGKVIRVSWSHCDPDMRRSGTGNVVIKNLNDAIDSAKTEEIFQKFGNILSCKVAVSEDGKSKGYGYEQFETVGNANTAIEELNGFLVGGKEMHVGKFVEKSDQILPSPDEKYTNLFIKNLGIDISEEHLREKFSEFGKIISLVITKDKNGCSKGFGYVNFENPDDARRATEAMNGSELGCKILYVARAQKKTEGEQISMHLFEERRKAQLIKNQGSNVYVKNIDGDVKDHELRELFSQCGEITSAELTLDEKGVSRGFGFVCFSTPEEANKAVNTFHGFMFGQKPLYVAIAQREEERQTQLQHKHAQGIAGLTIPPDYWSAKYPHLFHPALGDLQLSEQPTLMYHPLSRHSLMRNLEVNELWARTPRDFLGPIKSRLVGKDYVNFTAACTSFLGAPLMPWSTTDFSHTRMLTIESGIIQMFNPLLNTISVFFDPQIPKLEHSEFLCARGQWVLMGQGYNIFFFNATTHIVISLPKRIDDEDNYCTNWTFTSPPDSFECFVIGVEFAGSPPAVYVTKVGETVWHYHDLFDNHFPDTKILVLSKSYNPIVMGDSVYLLGDEGDLGILKLKGSSAERPSWYFFWTSFTIEEQKKVKRIYAVKDSDNECLVIVFRMDIEHTVQVWRYRVTNHTLVRERLFDLNGKTLFVSSGSGYLKQCSEGGFENKIFFPMLHGEHNSVFFCLKKQKFYSYDYSTNKGVSDTCYLHIGNPISCVWIDDYIF